MNLIENIITLLDKKSDNYINLFMSTFNYQFNSETVIFKIFSSIVYSIINQHHFMTENHPIAFKNN